MLDRAARATLHRGIGAAREDDVEAVVESALLALVRENHAALRAFSGRSSLGGYLQAITAKIALNYIRGERRSGWLRSRPLGAELDVPAQDLPEGEDPHQLDALRGALRQLPPRDRLILKMFHLDGASYREIAPFLGIAFNAVSPALIRARDKLRALLERKR